MKIKEKLNLDYNGLIKYGPINIVAFGDSVTHGAVAPGQICYDTVYFERLKNKLHEVRNYVPINVINAGIGGITAKASLNRIQSQVLCHNPDLVIVCFGLNDVNFPLEEYLSSLQTIFEECKAQTDVVFMTPNMLNTRIAADVSQDCANYAVKTAEMQNTGKMDLYMQKAVELANRLGITVCNCYSEWKKLSKTQDTTLLLANRINHPTREMHELFANALFKTIMEDGNCNFRENDSTMLK